MNRVIGWLTRRAVPQLANDLDEARAVNIRLTHRLDRVEADHEFAAFVLGLVIADNGPDYLDQLVIQHANSTR